MKQQQEQSTSKIDDFVFHDTPQAAFQQWLRLDHGDTNQLQNVTTHPHANVLSTRWITLYARTPTVNHLLQNTILSALDRFQDNSKLSKGKRALAWYVLGQSHSDVDIDCAPCQHFIQFTLIAPKGYAPCTSRVIGLNVPRALFLVTALLKQQPSQGGPRHQSHKTFKLLLTPMSILGPSLFPMLKIKGMSVTVRLVVMNRVLVSVMIKDKLALSRMSIYLMSLLVNLIKQHWYSARMRRWFNSSFAGFTRSSRHTRAAWILKYWITTKWCRMWQKTKHLPIWLQIRIYQNLFIHFCFISYEETRDSRRIISKLTQLNDEVIKLVVGHTIFR